MNRLQLTLLRCEKSLHTGNALWWLLLWTGLLAIAITGVAVLQWQRLTEQEASLREQSRSAQALLVHRDSVVRTASAAAHADFAQSLPGMGDMWPVLATLQRSIAEAHVVLANVQFHRRSATQDLLARTDMSVSLRGQSQQLKQVLTELLARYPNATLMRLTLRPSSPPYQIEATMVIGVWGAPLLPSTTAGAMTVADR